MRTRWPTGPTWEGCSRCIGCRCKAPVIAFPANGDTLQYEGVDHVIRLAWSGVAQANYAIEYEVGEGAYHLAGELIEPTNEPVYGPFQVGFWNSLVMYNPWKFRVYRTDNPQQKSEWVTFYLAAAEGEVSVWDLSVLWLQLVVLPAELGQLAVGIGRALGDLAVWLAADALPYIAAGVVALVLLRTLFGSLYLRAGPRDLRAWFAALVYVAFVYSTIPYMPDLVAFTRLCRRSDTSCGYCRGGRFRRGYYRFPSSARARITRCPATHSWRAWPPCMPTC